MSNILNFIEYFTNNFESIKKNLCWAVLILIIGLIIIIVRECRRQGIDENDTANIKILIGTFLPAIAMAFVYMIVSSYENFDNCFYVIVASLFGCIYLIETQNKDTDGVATSLDGLSGAIFFASAIINPCFFMLLYIGKIIYFYIKSREDYDKTEIYNQILSSIIKICSIVIIVLIESIVDFFTDYSFEQKLIYYAILLVGTETLLPLIENYLFEFISNKTNA